MGIEWRFSGADTWKNGFGDGESGYRPQPPVLSSVPNAVVRREGG